MDFSENDGIPPVMSILNHLHDETHLQKSGIFVGDSKTVFDHTKGVSNMNVDDGIKNHVVVLPSLFCRYLFVHLVLIVWLSVNTTIQLLAR